MKPTTENIIEASAIEILQSLGWVYAYGKEILDHRKATCANFAQVQKAVCSKIEQTEKLKQEVVSSILEHTSKYTEESVLEILLNSKTETMRKPLKTNTVFA